MPLLAKFLVLLNILATGGFIYLASLDYGMRQSWALAAFQLELAIDGLPLDRADPGPVEKGERRRNVVQPLADDLGDQTSPGFLKDMFKAAGAGQAVNTQLQEIDRVQKVVQKELAGLGEDGRRQRLRDMLLALGSTFAERQEVLKQVADPNVTVAELEKMLMAKFEACRSDKRDTAAKRRDVAHVLYNLDPGVESHRRLGMVVGLRAYVDEAEGQGRLLREMAETTKFESGDDRRRFEEAYLLNRDRIIELGLQLERHKSDLVDKERLKKRIDEEIIKPQQERIVKLDEEKKDTEKLAKGVLADQAELEKKLFELHRQISNLLVENLRLEQEIRDRELGRKRGGRQ